MLTRSPNIVVYRQPSRHAQAKAAATPTPKVVTPSAGNDTLHRDAMAAADRHDQWFQDVKKTLEKR